MQKNYQTNDRRARAGRTTPKKAKLDAAQAAHEGALRLPEAVTITIAELAGELSLCCPLAASERLRRMLHAAFAVASQIHA